MRQLFFRRWFVLFSFSFLVVFIVVQYSFASWNPSLVKDQLEQMNSENRQSLHHLLKRAYIGYLGVEDRYNQSKPLNGDTLFADLNHLLKETMEPQISNGKQLSETYWQRVGDRTYLDDFTVRELRVRGLMFSNEEDYKQARHNLEKAVILSDRIGDHMNLAFALNNLAYSNFHLQRVDEAVQNLERAIALTQEMQNVRASSLFYYNLGWIYINAGRWDEAIPLFEKTASISQQHSLPIRQMAALVNLGAIHLSQGNRKEAGQAFSKSLKMARQINSLRLRAMSAIDYAIVLILEDSYQEAAQLLDEALSIFEEQGKVFMRSERVLLEQKALRLLVFLDKKTEGRVVSAHLGDQREPVQVASNSLHSHFEHILMPMANFTAPVPPAARLAGLPTVPLQVPKGKVSISMKSLTVPTKELFNMPVYFAIPSGVKLSSLTFQVTYPKEDLSFADLEKGFLLQSGFKTITTNSAHPSEKAFDILEVSISSERETNIPSGLVMYLSFKVADKVDQGSIFLHNETVMAETIEGGSIPKSQLVAKDQAVTILGEDMVPTILCFFYMH